MEEIYKKADELVELMYTRMIDQYEAKALAYKLIRLSVMEGIDLAKEVHEEAAKRAIDNVFKGTSQDTLKD
jgi:hypothetical protein